jgi:hypothetical protein
MNTELLEQEVTCLKHQVVVLEADVRKLNRAIGRLEGKVFGTKSFDMPGSGLDNPPRARDCESPE